MILLFFKKEVSLQRIKFYLDMDTSVLDNKTSLNLAQISFLQGIRYIKTEEDALELKEIISNYYIEKLQKEADLLWDKGILGNFLLDEHLRTPYK